MKIKLSSMFLSMFALFGVGCSESVEAPKEKTAEVNQAVLPNIALWVAGNAYGSEYPYVAGYTASHISSSYSGAPDVTFTLPWHWGSMHGLSVRNNGDLLITTSENGDDGQQSYPDNPECLWVVEDATARAGGALSEGSTVRRYDIPDWEGGASTSARAVTSIAQGTGDILLQGRNGPIVRFTEAMLGFDTPAEDYLDAFVYYFDEVDPEGGSIIGDSWDIEVDYNGRLWVSSAPHGGDTSSEYDDYRNFIRVTNAEITDSTPDVLHPEKWLNGSNFGPNYGFALSPGYGMYYADYGAGNLKFWSNSLLPGNSNPANPSPTRTYTNAEFYDLQSLALDDSYGLWVGMWEATEIWYFSNYQLSTGGSKTPSRVITLPTVGGEPFNPIVVRLTPGNTYTVR